MRFRQIELVRYGGFADRLLDLGEGKIDLHLVVGPNEAGKSTMLAAIGDLLFGIPAQSSQNWRYDYGDLRIRAHMTTAAGELDLTRRKGKKNTLLGPDGVALPDDILAPLLNGMDRRSFERMFGLDHAKLREGGEAILEGKDDAARIVLEAGTGFAGIGQNLKALDELAGGLFKPSAQLPAVNRLMRERTEALALVRSQTLADSDWVAIRSKREVAEATRTALVEEGRSLAQRAHAIERLNRIRPLLVRQSAELAARATLGTAPSMPADAQEQWRAALAERRTAQELRDLEAARQQRAVQDSAQIVLPTALLAAKAEIETLCAGLAVVEKASSDIVARRAEQAGMLERSIRIRQDANIAAHHEIPGAGLRKRVRDMLEAGRRLERDHATLHQNRRVIEEESANLPPAQEEGLAEGLLERLRLAFDAIPTDAAQRMASLNATCDRTRLKLEKAMAALSPWAGSIDALLGAVPPGPAETLIAANALEATREAIRLAQGDIAGLEKEGIGLRSELASLLHAGALPTPQVVAAARAVRDELIDEVRLQLGGKEKRDDADIGAALQAATGEADRLADGREADAQRIAQHGLFSRRCAEVEERIALAARRAHVETGRLEGLHADWAAVLDQMGFARALPPEDVDRWRAARVEALLIAEDLGVAMQLRDVFASSIEDARKQLDLRLADTGCKVAPTDRLDDCIALARQQMTRLEMQVRACVLAAEQRRRIEDARQKCDWSEQDLAARQGMFEADRKRLLAQSGLPAQWPADAVADALDAFDELALDDATRAALDRQIDLDRRQLVAFENAFDASIMLLGETSTERRFERLRALQDELARAVRAQAMLARLEDDKREASKALGALDHRLAMAGQAIGDLMALAGVADEAALGAVIEASRLVRAHDTELLRLGAELEEQCEGLDLAVVTDAAAALLPDEAAAELEAIRIRREDIEEARERIGRDLAAAETAIESAATATGAADAQQDAAAISAAMADAAERHIEAASAAALLRWVIDRHRATAQAPLMEKAGAMFARVTAGAFTSLVLDYDDDDRPMIRGVRGDASRVGVEGMSEGTRDQLYLALRLGAIATREGHQTLPVICDDLLITADDGRAAEMLRVLAAASTHNQVILFSHHDHIVDVAKTALGEGGFMLHRIERDIVALTS